MYTHKALLNLSLIVLHIYFFYNPNKQNSSQIYEDKLIKKDGKLPKKMKIDEFNATKDTISKILLLL